MKGLPGFARSAMLLACMASTPLTAFAESGFSSRSKACPVGYGCVYVADMRDGRPLSQGLDILAGDSSWYALPYDLYQNASQVRNRNSTTRRSVVIRDHKNVCLALRYDDRTWVHVNQRAGGPPFSAYYMRLTSVSRAPGSTTNVAGCASTRWL